MSTQPLEISGVQTDLEELLLWRTPARQLNLAQQRKILAPRSGEHRSRFRGRGVNFSEARPYQPGDDVRNIHWRVTARAQKPYTKLFTEEREQPTLIVLDHSDSLFFGSQVCFKSVMAAHIAALLAWASQHRGDRTGGLIFNEREYRLIKSHHTSHAVLELLRTVCDFNQRAINSGKADTFSFTDHLLRARQFTKPGSELFIISDFYDFSSSSQEELARLSQHNDLVCIQVYDPLEKEPPPAGYYPVTNGTERHWADWYSTKARDDFRLQAEQRQTELEQQLQTLRIPLISIATNQAPLVCLQQGLGIRAPGIKTHGIEARSIKTKGRG